MMRPVHFAAAESAKTVPQAGVKCGFHLRAVGDNLNAPGGRRLRMLYGRSRLCGRRKHKTAKQTLDGARAENTKSAQTNSTGEPQMIDFEKLTPQIVADECQRAIDECDTGVAAIVAIPADERTFENTFVALESAVDHIGQASGWYAFMAYVAEDEALRETARDWEQKLSQYAVQLGFREDLYEAVSEFAATPEALALRGEEQRLLERTMLDYRRNGFELPTEQRARVEELKNRLVELGVQFQKAI